MISLKIWLLLWPTLFVLALPSLYTNNSQSYENLTLIFPKIFNNQSTILLKQRKQKTSHNRTVLDFHNYDIYSYRSSWGFIDKDTIRVSFRISESLVKSIVSTQFLVRHARTNHIRMYNEQNEIMITNSTVILYLHNIKHGRHAVCLLLYTSKLMRDPKHIFCQDVVFNFQKYGHHDDESDEYGNTFVFLLTQYGIVLGMLCMLQLVHAARKRRFLRTVYEKLNAVRNYMSENHHKLSDNEPSIDLSTQPNALQYLMHNLNRAILFDIDEQPQSGGWTGGSNTDVNNETKLSRRPSRRNQKYFKFPSVPHEYSSVPPFETRRATVPTIKTHNAVDYKDDTYVENDFHNSAYQEQHLSIQSVSHILEQNKPWMARIAKNGTIEHSIINSTPL